MMSGDSDAGCSRTDSVAPARADIGRRARHGQLEINALARPQSVKVLERWCDVLVPRRSMYHVMMTVSYTHLTLPTKRIV